MMGGAKKPGDRAEEREDLLDKMDLKAKELTSKKSELDIISAWEVGASLKQFFTSWRDDENEKLFRKTSTEINKLKTDLEDKLKSIKHIHRNIEQLEYLDIHKTIKEVEEKLKEYSKLLAVREQARERIIERKLQKYAMEINTALEKKDTETSRKYQQKIGALKDTAMQCSIDLQKEGPKGIPSATDKYLQPILNLCQRLQQAFTGADKKISLAESKIEDKAKEKMLVGNKKPKSK